MASAAAKSLQSCPTLCDPMDCSPPGSSVPGILQERTMELVAISFSNAWKWKVKVKSLSCVRLFATPWTAAYQAPPSVGFSRQEYWSGMPLPSPFPIVGYEQCSLVAFYFLSRSPYLVLHNSFILSLLLFSLKYLGIVLVAVLTSLFIGPWSLFLWFFFQLINFSNGYGSLYCFSIVALQISKI